MPTLTKALQKFEATEANLGELEKLWQKIAEHIPGGPAFDSPPEYDELCLAFRRILRALPAIDGFPIQDCLHEYDAIGQMRLYALEVDEIEIKVSAKNTLEEQGRVLRQYRFLLDAKRRELVRDRIIGFHKNPGYFLLCPAAPGSYS